MLDSVTQIEIFFLRFLTDEVSSTAFSEWYASSWFWTDKVSSTDFSEWDASTWFWTDEGSMDFSEWISWWSKKKKKLC